MDSMMNEEIQPVAENLGFAELCELARGARANGEREEALKLYSRALELDPENWEAVFYTGYLKARGYRREDITEAPKVATPAALKALELIDAIEDAEERQAAAKEVASCVTRFGAQMHSVSMRKFLEIRMAVRYQFLSAHVERLTGTRDLLYSVGDKLEEMFSGNADMGLYIAGLWAEGVRTNTSLVYYVDDKDQNRLVIRERTGRIRRYDDSFIPPKEDKPGDGCYIATCAYGSYDCPEVWTLRRFRDFALAKTAAGRAFIRVYYAVSPKLVGVFGGYEWFRSACLRPLNAFVAWLKGKGYEDSPYEDKNW